MIIDRQTWISGYRTLWMIVTFDLPVTEKIERKAATGFRNYLLDEGFGMAQFSVYYRLLDGKDAASSMERRIKQKVPPKGSVHILTITDKQYENIRIFEGKRSNAPEKPNQLVLF
ncbi:MAG: CRISPR-associated endonuclease Cas2 [Rhodospirillaceae bacterium]